MRKHYEVYLRILIVTYITFFSIYSLFRHWSYLSTGYDLGIFMQSLWSTIHNQGFFFNTGEWQDIGTYSHFGVHNQPILFLLLPIYKILPYAETLLILQTIALGFGAATLFKFAKHVLNDDRRAFYLSLMYLFNPLIQGINIFDFHPVSLAVPFIFLIPYYFEKREYIKTTIFSLVVLSVKEDSGLILTSIGLMFLLMKHRIKELSNPRKWRKIIIKNKIPTLLILLGIFWIILSLFVIIPHYNGGKYPYFDDKRLDRYGGEVYWDNAIAYFLITMLSISFLPLWDIQLFSASALLWLEVLLSNKPEMVSLGHQYPYMLIPMLLILSVYNLKKSRAQRL